MKNKIASLLMGLACLGALASCGGTPSSGTSTPTRSAVESTPAESLVPVIADSYTDIDSLNLESGDYMVVQTVYSFDKANKKLIATKYEDYDSYKNKQGTVLYDGSVRFVKVTSMMLGTLNAAYFEIDGDVRLLYLDSAGKIYLSTHSSMGWTTSSAVAVSEIPLFSMGNYVSEKQTQNKATEEGSYIYDSKENLIKEEFYLFLELTETKASIFVGDNPSTHAPAPLHSVENYKTLIVSGKLMIRIPHTNGEFNCSLTARSETEISFNNSMERRGDYSASGVFTKIA